MYFQDRIEAGQLLADELTTYIGTDTVVMSLSDGGLVVGEQIARKLNCQICMLYTDSILVPGDKRTVFGTVDQTGNVTYNSLIPTGQLDEFISEFHGYFDQERIKSIHKLNSLISPEGQAEPNVLRGHNIIVVTDGAKTGAQFDAALAFLKPIAVKKVIAAVPIASVTAVDRLHVLFDELHCANVTANYISTDHYYDQPHIPGHTEILRSISDIASHI